MSFNRKQTELDGTIRYELLGFLETEQSYTGKWHDHPFSETIYVINGHFTLELEGQSIELNSNQAVIIRPQIQHRMTCTNKAAILYIGCSYIHLGSFIAFPEPQTQQISNSSVLKLLKNISQKYIEDSSAENISDYLLPLDFYWYSLIKKEKQTKNYDIILERIKEYLALHPNEQISVCDIAKKFYLSPHYLGNKFCKYTGMSIKKYHSRLRLEQALHLIESSSMSISQISDKLGFNTPQYFSMCFKSHFGISPSAIVRSNNYSKTGL